jgi:hypothetical protein
LSGVALFLDTNHGKEYNFRIKVYTMKFDMNNRILINKQYRGGRDTNAFRVEI